ncbi:unnamed protein product [Closterium sp. Yama58-4]|nr:unnamed protein product [Closterium sp. Yama58-4]
MAPSIVLQRSSSIGNSSAFRVDSARNTACRCGSRNGSPGFSHRRRSFTAATASISVNSSGSSSSSNHGFLGSGHSFRASSRRSLSDLAFLANNRHHENVHGNSRGPCVSCAAFNDEAGHDHHIERHVAANQLRQVESQPGAQLATPVVTEAAEAVRGASVAALSEVSGFAAPASLSQALLSRSATRTVASVGASAITAARLRPSTLLRGKGGVVMAVALAVAGIVTMIKSHDHQHQLEYDGESEGEVCDECGGYGLCCCTLCGGTGAIRWEGKYDRKDPCPACVGEGCSKCPKCGSSRRNKAVPPIVLERRVF